MGLEMLLGPRPDLNMNVGPDPYAGVRPNSDYGPVKLKGENPLGFIGDALAYLSGNLGERKKEEALRGALQDYEADPQGAIQRVMKIDPKLGLTAAMNLQKGATMGDLRSAQLASIDEDRKSKLLLRHQANVARMAAATLRDPTGKSYPGMRNNMLKYAEKHGVDLSTFGLPEVWDESARTALSSLAATDWTPAQQATDQNAERGLDIRDEANDLRQESINLQGAALSENDDDIVRTITDENGDVVGVTRKGDTRPLGVKARDNRKKNVIESLLGDDDAPKKKTKPSKPLFSAGKIVQDKNGRRYRVGKDGKGYPI